MYKKQVPLRLRTTGFNSSTDFIVFKVDISILSYFVLHYFPYRS